MARVACGPHLFGHLQTTQPNFPQYKQNLFVHQCCFSYSVRDLNLVLSIYTRLSILEVAKGWVGIVSGIFFNVVSGVKFFYVVDVGS